LAQPTHVSVAAVQLEAVAEIVAVLFQIGSLLLDSQAEALALQLFDLEDQEELGFAFLLATTGASLHWESAQDGLNEAVVGGVRVDLS